MGTRATRRKPSGVGRAVGVAVSVAADVGAGVCVTVGVPVTVGMTVSVRVGDALAVGDMLAVAVRVAVWVPVGDGVRVRVGVPVDVRVGVAVRLGVSVHVAVPVGDADGDGMAVAGCIQTVRCPPGSSIRPVSVAASLSPSMSAGRIRANVSASRPRPSTPPITRGVALPVQVRHGIAFRTIFVKRPIGVKLLSKLTSSFFRYPPAPHQGELDSVDSASAVSALAGMPVSTPMASRAVTNPT